MYISNNLYYLIIKIIKSLLREAQRIHVYENLCKNAAFVTIIFYSKN